MMRYLALLRGINVGGHRRVEMSRLAAVFESSGATNVSTYINTGNVVFDADSDCAQQLAEVTKAAIKLEFGFEVKTLVVTRTTMNSIASDLPSHWRNDKEMKCDVLFTLGELDPDQRSRLPIVAGIDEVIFTAGALIWRVDRADQSDSGLRRLAGSSVSQLLTARNVNTFRALLELVNQAS